MGNYKVEVRSDLTCSSFTWLSKDNLEGCTVHLFSLVEEEVQFKIPFLVDDIFVKLRTDKFIPSLEKIVKTRDGDKLFNLSPYINEDRYSKDPYTLIEGFEGFLLKNLSFKNLNIGTFNTNIKKDILDLKKVNPLCKKVDLRVDISLLKDTFKSEFPIAYKLLKSDGFFDDLEKVIKKIQNNNQVYYIISKKV